MKTAPTKAAIAAGTGLVGAFLASLLANWTDTDPLSARDFVVALYAAVTTGGVAGVLTYWFPNNEVGQGADFEEDLDDQATDDAPTFNPHDDRDPDGEVHADPQAEAEDYQGRHERDGL